eukprot:TRINITY_DN453_c0_g1_i1.p1 TRINITY_DN453_c0_g1~~TRINITY_DN453_c0_g1_i1.p1  ORF type:complete len:290 (-),score=86.25 TRINITY_DN453_c0_g1_i1:57-926(-)
MGQGFSKDTLKAQLKMAVTRCNLSISKEQNTIKIQKRKIAEMLLDKKVENARIRAEGVMREQNLIYCYELLALRCELLSTRILLIAQSPQCPDDLFMPIATLIYCAQRLEVQELVNCAHQFGYRWGKDWVQGLLHGARYVDPQVLKYLDINPPSKKEITEFLVTVAAECDVDWEPSPEDLEQEPEYPPATVNPHLQADSPIVAGPYPGPGAGKQIGNSRTMVADDKEDNDSTAAPSSKPRKSSGGDGADTGMSGRKNSGGAKKGGGKDDGDDDEYGDLAARFDALKKKT